MSAFRYDPARRAILSGDRVIATVGDGIGSVVGNKMAAGPELLDAAKKLDRLSFVIESAVHAHASRNYDAVVAAIRDLCAGIKKATGETV